MERDGERWREMERDREETQSNIHMCGAVLLAVWGCEAIQLLCTHTHTHMYTHTHTHTHAYTNTDTYIITLHEKAIWLHTFSTSFFLSFFSFVSLTVSDVP
jgi:hypothetical protein